jgi:hypothetical protein
MICTLIICAVQTLGVMTVSAHRHGEYESVTPGVYAVTPDGYTAGVYSNSHGDASAFIGRQFTRGPVSLLVGGVAGYGKPSPLVVPSVKVGPVRLSYIPQHPSKPTGSDALHLSYEWSIK